MTSPARKPFQGKFSNHPDILEMTRRIKALQKLRQARIEKLRKSNNDKTKHSI